MKKVLIVAVIILLVAVIGFGVWGYVDAQKVKKQVQTLEQATSSTLILQNIDPNSAELQLNDWRNLSEKALATRATLEKMSGVPGSHLLDKLTRFYSAKAQDKYMEARYLQFVLNGQRNLDLKADSRKSKGQIETNLQALKDMQNEINQSNFTLGPEFKTLQSELEQAVNAFDKESNSMMSNMTYESPAVQLNAANLDKTIDEMKLAITKSLNDWVSLQDEIKNEIGKMATANWVNPLAR